MNRKMNSRKIAIVVGVIAVVLAGIYIANTNLPANDAPAASPTPKVLTGNLGEITIEPQPVHITRGTTRLHVVNIKALDEKNYENFGETYTLCPGVILSTEGWIWGGEGNFFRVEVLTDADVGMCEGDLTFHMQDDVNGRAEDYPVHLSIVVDEVTIIK